MDDLIIISDGNEIAYAKTVLDLFRTQVNEETVVRSALGDLYNAELYSFYILDIYEPILSVSLPKFSKYIIKLLI